MSVMSIFAAMMVSGLCVGLSAYFLHRERKHWGWFLFAGVVIAVSVMSPEALKSPSHQSKAAPGQTTSQAPAQAR
jgi:hypothetical protein